MVQWKAAFSPSNGDSARKHLPHLRGRVRSGPEKNQSKEKFSFPPLVLTKWLSNEKQIFKGHAIKLKKPPYLTLP